MTNRTSTVCLAAALSAAVASSASASFHLMQVEQVIMGVKGNPNAQAIQLRLRSAGQNQLQNSRLVAVDATGASQIIVSDPAAVVTNNAAGSRVLICTTEFLDYLDASVTPDFIITTPIPASSFAAGRIMFQNNTGTVTYWSVSWGGAGYTGANTGATFNDADGNFGPAFAGSAPSTGLFALRFLNPAANAMSTNNAADYAYTATAAAWIDNAGNTANLQFPCPGDVNGDNFVNFDDLNAVLLEFGNSGQLAGTGGDANGDGNVDFADLNDVLSNWETACP